MKTAVLLFCTLFLVCPSVQAQAAGQKDLGALSPQQAVQYIRQHPDVVIVDVASRDHYERKHFHGAVNIPIENISSKEAEGMYKDLPAGRPVIMHCRLGMIVPGAYRNLRRLRPDIPEISYIDGKPPFDDANLGKQQ